ncbi:acetylxylan esterase [Paenibacillus koleovorans]|uniref:acetylxylan esterase n=1 Tax=Paenibacillus koleovorans TaxID=121608 RepID=UPI000FD7D1CF|nr:acetylxylan esterase [Paenibacillus koleovorans]
MNAVARRKRDLDQLGPALTMEPERIDAFWEPKIRLAKEKPLHVCREPQPSVFPTVRTEKLIYEGLDGTPIHAWFMVPAAVIGNKGTPLPCVVKFPGYAGDRGLEERYAVWLLLGYAVLAVDARGQLGETGNRMEQEHGWTRGWVSMGVLDKECSYYMALATDVIRAMEVAACQPEVDASRIAAIGASQGGGIALLAGALSDKVAVVAADIPNMCRLDYGVMHSTGSVSELAPLVKRYPDRLDAVLDTLAHFDIVNLAHRFKAPVLMSVGWKDPVCPPEMVYAAYNRLEVEKCIYDYPFSGHEVGEEHARKVIQFLQRHLEPIAAH